MPPYTFSIRVDVARNVMYIVQRGRPCAADLLDLKREYVSEIANLQPGFTIVNDQREMEPYDDAAMEVATELVRITNEHRASRVIRIVPADVLSTFRLSSTLEAGASRYASIRVSTPQEAEEALDAFSESSND